MHVYMRRTHRLAGCDELAFEALRGDRFVVPAEDLNAGFNRRVRLLCREHGFEPETLVAPAVWEEAEWPPGDDLYTLATERVARHAPPHIATAPLVPALDLPLELVWREDDDSPVLHSFLELATPERAHGS
jgi:hypothetical protein